MYKHNQLNETSLKVNESFEGERIETKVQRMTENKEPITDGAPPIYTERSEGVNPLTDIRTDKWEYMNEAMEAATGAAYEKRELRNGEKTYDTMTTEQQTAFNTKYPNNKHAIQALKNLSKNDK